VVECTRGRWCAEIIARLPFLERADHPAGCRCSWSRGRRRRHGDEVADWSVRVSGWNADVARALAPLAEILAVPDTAFDGAALLVSIADHGFEAIKLALIKAGGLGCALRPSSAATQRAIRCPLTRIGKS